MEELELRLTLQLGFGLGLGKIVVSMSRNIVSFINFYKVPLMGAGNEQTAPVLTVVNDQTTECPPLEGFIYLLESSHC